MSDIIDILVQSRFDGSGSVAAQRALVDLNQPTAQIVAGLRAASAAAGDADTAFLQLVGAASQQALAVGNAAKADELLAAAGLKAAGAEELVTQKTIQRVQLEARSLAASGDRLGAINLLANGLAKEAKETDAVVRADLQLIQLENQAASAATREADARLRVVAADARALAVKKDFAGALQLTQGAIAAETSASAGSLAALGAQAAQYEKSGTLAGAFGAQVAGLLNPLLLVTVGVGAATAAVKTFGDAFKFKAELDETNASIKVLLTGVRNTSEVFDGAQQFANRYKLTQKETSDAIADSIPVIRASKSSIEDILSVFTRLTILKPGKTFNDASRAISELQSGNAVSLERIFNVPLDKANALKKEIQGGADAVQVLNRFLTESGVGASALEVRTQGAAGALRDAAIAQERLTIAQAKFGQGPGVFFVKEYTNVLNTLANAGTGDEKRAAASGKLIGAVQNYQQYTQAVRQANEAARGGNVVAGSDADTGKLSVLTQAQFNYAQSLIATGVSAREASDRAQDLNPTLIKIGQVQAQVGKTGELSAQGLDELANTILHTAETGPAGVAATDSLIQAYLAGGISAEEFRQALIRLKNQHQDVQAAEERARVNSQALAEQRRGEIGGSALLTDAIEKSNAELKDSAEKGALDAAQKALQQAATNKLTLETNRSADAFIRLNPNMDASQAFAAAAAAGLGPLVAEVIRLRLEADKTRAALLGTKLEEQTARQLTGADSDEAGIREGKRAGVVAGRAQGQAQADAAAAALAQAELQQGNVVPALDRAQTQLNQLTKDGKQGTAEYINKQNEVNNLLGQQRSLAKGLVDDQIAYAKATDNTVEARRLLNQQLADAKAAGDVGAQAKALEALKALDKPGRGPKGISTLDRSETALIENYRDRLAEVNDKLAHGNLNQLQRNQYLKEQADLQNKINDAVAKQRDTLLDIDELTIKDRQADRDDVQKRKEANAIIRALGGRTDARAVDLRGRAEDALALTNVENQKRGNAIAEKQRQADKLETEVGPAQATAGASAGATPARDQGAPAPISGPQTAQPNAPQQSAQQSAAGGPAEAQNATLTVNVQIDGKTAWSGMETFAWGDLLRAVQTVKLQKGA